jgi:tetratricopeptide (TPR) repeat protein
VNIESLIRAARSAEATGQNAKAVQLCNQALFLKPACVDALLILGALAARQGRVGDAEGLLRRAYAADPSSYDAVRWLTTLLIGRSGGTEAVKFGRAAVSLRPMEAESHAILGLAAMGAGDSGTAIEGFARALEISPNMAGAYHNLGVAYQREDSFQEAVDAFERAIELAPKVAESHIHLGRCYVATNRPDEAIVCANRALELNPKSVMAKQLLSDATYLAVLGEKGMERIRQTVEQDPHSGFPHALLASRLQEQGNFTDAEPSILKSIDLQPEQGFAYYLFAHNRRIRDDDRPMVLQMEALGDRASLHPEDLQYLHFGLGKAYDDLKDFERAIRHFDLAHEHPGQTPQHGQRKTERFCQIFTKELLDRCKDLGLDSDEPIFIFGMPRSGTTLLEQILSRHSSVGGAGELFFWRDHSRKIVNLRERTLNTRELTKAGQQYLDFIRSKDPGMAHITDKFPSNYLYLGLLSTIYPKARFIHARRNPLDTCLSIYMRPFHTTDGLGRTRRQIVETYQSYLASMEHWRSILGPERILDVDYEALVQDPETWTRKVIEHCGLAWEDACLRPQEGDRRVLTFSMWQVRQPVYTTSVERWRNYEPWLGIFRELIPSLPAKS